MAGLAARQHGVVARRQLLALGMTAGAVKHFVAAGRLHPLHRGVYAVGHRALSHDGKLLAAVLAFGTRTAVTHRPALILHGLLDETPQPIHVTTTSTSGGRWPGLVLHQTRRLPGADTTRIRGIPAASLARALVEVAGSAPPAEFTRVFNTADRKRLIDPLALAGQLRRGRKGSAVVRARLDVFSGARPTESELEDLFLRAVVLGHGIAPPVSQSSPLPGRAQRVDFCWPYERVVVEVDGRAWHAIQAAWGEDHDRDLRLRLAGYAAYRYTWRQLTRTPELVAADVQRALARGRAAN